jgi:dCMP deaminase
MKSLLEEQKVMNVAAAAATQDLNLMKSNRPSWPATWMAIAHVIAARSYDPRTKVGSIIVSEDNVQLISLGYNGSYHGGPNVPESLEPGQSGFLHAELNACLKSDYNFPKKKIMYVTVSPCINCAKAIIQSRISQVVYDDEYRDTSGINLLKSVGIKVLQLQEAIVRDV